MLRIAAILIISLSLIGSASLGPAAAQAQQKASKSGGQCSLEACIDVCNKKGGRTCNLYCSNELARRGCR
jgi:hypothetical protein